VRRKVSTRAPKEPAIPCTKHLCYDSNNTLLHTPTTAILSALFKDKLANVSKSGNSRMYLEHIYSNLYILVKKVYFRTFPENREQRQQQTTQQHSQYEDDLDSLLNQGSPADRSDVQSKCCAQAITSSRGGCICGFILIKKKEFLVLIPWRSLGSKMSLKRPSGLKKIPMRPIPKSKQPSKQESDDAFLDEMLE
jgi:hypothetical protein